MNYLYNINSTLISQRNVTKEKTTLSPRKVITNIFNKILQPKPEMYSKE